MDIPEIGNLSDETTTIIIFLVLGIIALSFFKKLLRLVFLVALGFALYYLL